MFEDVRIQEYILSGREKMVVLPEAISLDGADFDQSYEDLIISSSNGDRVFVRGFFGQTEYPVLLCSDGELVSGDLAAAFVKLSPCALSALMQIDNHQESQIDSAS